VYTAGTNSPIATGGGRGAGHSNVFGESERCEKVKRWLFERLVPGHPHPFRLFGGLICVYSGKWADIRLRKNWLVVSWRKNRRYAFISPDGTPNRALWGVGNFNRY